MPTARVLHRPLLPLVATVAALLLACSDTQEVPREPFNPPPDQTNKFLGYFTASDKLTACGNCHAEKQGDWATTKHAQAWGDLVASGHQTAECNSCHSVSERGNAAAAPAGYSAVADTAYQDVQCESCHGSGFEHASSPTIENRPLATVDDADGSRAVGGVLHLRLLPSRATSRRSSSSGASRRTPDRDGGDRGDRRRTLTLSCCARVTRDGMSSRRGDVDDELRREERRDHRSRTRCRPPARSATIRTRRITRDNFAGRSTTPIPTTTCA